MALGYPHLTTRELEYKGMRIPLDSRLHINAWAIHHNARRHEDPDTFHPWRYMAENLPTQQSLNLADSTKRDHVAFGSGRIVCPGMQWL